MRFYLPRAAAFAASALVCISVCWGAEDGQPDAVDHPSQVETPTTLPQVPLSESESRRVNQVLRAIPRGAAYLEAPLQGDDLRLVIRSYQQGNQKAGDALFLSWRRLVWAEIRRRGLAPTTDAGREMESEIFIEILDQVHRNLDATRFNYHQVMKFLGGAIWAGANRARREGLVRVAFGAQQGVLHNHYAQLMRALRRLGARGEPITPENLQRETGLEATAAHHLWELYQATFGLRSTSALLPGSDELTVEDTLRRLEPEWGAEQADLAEEARVLERLITQAADHIREFAVTRFGPRRGPRNYKIFEGYILENLIRRIEGEPPNLTLEAIAQQEGLTRKAINLITLEMEREFYGVLGRMLVSSGFLCGELLLEATSSPGTTSVRRHRSGS